jgi:hypothetical protein
LIDLASLLLDAIAHALFEMMFSGRAALATPSRAHPDDHVGPRDEVIKSGAALLMS